ncbi:MAG: hypothetical protein ABIH09_00270 [Candidatus Omnitrophota bacterium]
MQKLVELVLEKFEHDVFTDLDVKILVKGSDNRRYGLVKRALANGEILRITKGIYCLTDKYRRNKLNLYSLAGKVYGPSYVSLESALSYHGWIPEAVYTVTSVSIKRSKDLFTPVGRLSYSHVPETIFYIDVERIRADDESIYLMANPLKALADYVYVYRKNWDTIEPVLQSLRIERSYLREKTDFMEIETLISNYSSKRVKNFLEAIKKEADK